MKLSFWVCSVLIVLGVDCARVPLVRVASTCLMRMSDMIHFTCDRCKRVIDSEQELRYVVRMEVEAVMDPIHEGEPQDDRDHLLEIDEILELADADQSDSVSDDVYHRRQYD